MIQGGLNHYFEAYPAIRAIYDFKQELHRLLCIKKQTRNQARCIIPELLEKVEALKASGFVAMRALGNALDDGWKRWHECGDLRKAMGLQKGSIGK